jgi:hypothetical protein
MLTTCWSAKGGSGTTTVVASLALVAAAQRLRPLVVDLCGDINAMFDHEEPVGPGLSDWLAADPGVGIDAIQRLLIDLGDIDLLVLSNLDAPFAPTRSGALCDWLRVQTRPVFVDAGSAATAIACALIDGADQSLLVTRLCYLSLRRAVTSPRMATGVIVVREPKRTLPEHVIVETLGLPIVATIDVTHQMAAVIDSGQLKTRMPTYVKRALKHDLVQVGA